MKTKKSKEKKQDNNVVYVGKKGVNDYIMAVLTQLNSGEKEVILKARGKCIVRAIDVEQIIKRKLDFGKMTSSVLTGTDEVEMENKEGKKYQGNLSTIEITIKK